MGNILRKGYKHDAEAGWRKQNEEAKVNPVYMYANLNKGGKLIDIYMENGIEGVEDYVTDNFRQFLYNEGKGATIKKVDYLRWLTKGQAQNQLVDTRYINMYAIKETWIGPKTSSLVDTRTDEEVLAEYKQGGFNEFSDHDACWDLEQRGAVGETVLHLLYLNATPIHLEIASVLLELYPKLSLDIYEGEEYFGESSLHLAIVCGDLESVKQLIECGANVNQRATGSFFLPEDQKKKKKIKKTNYEAYAYYGEYPLSFAACFGHEAIYDYLIEHGANPNAQDSFGNTVLHMVVINDMVEMFSYAVKHHKKRVDQTIQNAAGLTPLTLACELGRHKIFNLILQISAIESWRFSNISCSVYPLDNIDTIRPDGTTDFKSALWIIVNGETDEHLDMLEGGVIRQLLDEKWRTFAKQRFFQRLVITIAHLILMSTALYTRPSTVGSKDPTVGPTDSSVNDLLGKTDAANILRYCCEIILCGGCLTTFLWQINETKASGVKGFVKNLKNAPAKAIFLLGSFLILLCIPLRFLGLRQIEESLLILAVPSSWALFLFYAKGMRLTGPFVTMIYKIFMGDMFRFGVIYIIFMVNFSQVFYFLFKDIEDQAIQTFKTPHGTAMSLFQMTLGEFKYEEFEKTRYPWITKLSFGMFMILVPILLLNMLIAMMGQTYQQVITKSEKEWRRQWAKIVVVLERAFKEKDLRKFQQVYSMRLTFPSQKGDVEEQKEHRGLTVIAASRKTKARQRKGAIANWKWMYKQTRKRITFIRTLGKDGLLHYYDVFDSDAGKLAHRKVGNHRRSSDVSQQSLAAAISQLAWEKDIDINMMQEVQDEIKRRKSISVHSDTVQTPLLNAKQDRRHNKIEGITNPAFTENHIQNGVVTPRPILKKTSKDSLNQEKTTSPKGNKKNSKSSLEDWDVETKTVLQKETGTPPKSGGSNAGKRTAKVAPSPIKRNSSQQSLSSLLDSMDDKQSTKTDTTTM